MLNKITRTPFKSVEKSKILELIHSDLCDFHSTPSLGNKRYVITFMDDYPRFFYVYLLHSIDKALNSFKVFKNEVKLKFNGKLKRLRTDKEREYYNPHYFQSMEIIHEITIDYAPQSNNGSNQWKLYMK